jgi:RHS repeat-associated protein
MSYDSYHRLTSENGPGGSVGYTYNAGSERQSMSIEGIEAAAYAYNPDGQLTGISTPNGNVAFAYDHDGRSTQTRLPNGDTENYAYNAASQLTSIDYKYPSGEQIGNLLYGRDALGRITTIAGSEARTNLPAALSEATYDVANELTSLAGQQYTYDADGNATGNGTSTNTWNDRNQLTGVTQGSNTFGYAYDQFGRRTTKIVNGVQTAYLYEGQNVARETTGGVTSQLVNGLGLDERFARVTNGETSTYLTTAQGGAPAATHNSMFFPPAIGRVPRPSVRISSAGTGPNAGSTQASALALAGTNGTPETQYTYDPFGATTSSGAASTNPFQYTGRENDGNGLQYNRARYYNPTPGRFISQDPLGMAGSGVNLYRYAADNPLNVTDPLGTTENPLETMPRQEGERIKELENEEAGRPPGAGGPAPPANLSAPKGTGGWGKIACEAATPIPGKAGAVVAGACGIEVHNQSATYLACRKRSKKSSGFFSKRRDSPIQPCPFEPG